MATLDQIIHAKAIEIGKLALSATTAAGSGHPTTALSLAHLTAVLMYRVMRWDPKRPRAPEAERLVLLAASGYMVHCCLDAAQALGQGGIAAGVVDAYCLPLDREALLQRAREAGAPILTVEDNYIGGLASKLAEAAAASTSPRVSSLVVGNLPKSGRTAEDVLAYVHLSNAAIVEAARALAG